MKELFHFAGYDVPKNIRLFQLTDMWSENSCHVYMEAQIFTPDSKRLVLHRSAHPHGSDQYDPVHAYYLCDLENGGAMTRLTDETGACAPCVSPDGTFFYYFVRQFDPVTWKGRILFKRRNLSGTDACELGCVSHGDAFAPAYYMYPLSTVSPDGKRVAATSPLEDDMSGFPEHALWIFDTETGGASVPVHGKFFCNLHMQYTRDPAHPHDIMIQHDHGSYSCQVRKELGTVQRVAALDAESGYRMRAVSAHPDDPKQNHTGCGLDLHVIRDDGTDWRAVPVGRDGVEHCQGHQCWRGRSDWVISSTLLFQRPSYAHQELVEVFPVPCETHDGKNTPGAVRNVLTRGIQPPHFLHFATDIAGKKIVSDFEADNGEWHLYTGTLGTSGKDPAALSMILNLGSREKSPWHPHPFLSPDGRWAFFNSSAGGKLDAYAVMLNP